MKYVYLRSLGIIGKYSKNQQKIDFFLEMGIKEKIENREYIFTNLYSYN
jgi:hypothetical protein